MTTELGQLTSRIDSLHVGMAHNSRILGEIISRVQGIEVIVDKRLPELASQHEMLRSGTQQCKNKLHETSKKDMRYLQDCGAQCLSSTR
jgi:hypothetical protein